MVHLGDIVQRFNIPEAGAISKTKNEARLERDFQPLVEILMQKYKVILVSDWLGAYHVIEYCFLIGQFQDDAKRAATNKPFLPKTMAEVRINIIPFLLYIDFPCSRSRSSLSSSSLRAATPRNGSSLMPALCLTFKPVLLMLS